MKMAWKSVGHLDLKGEKNRPCKNDAFRAFACLIDYMYLIDENTTVNGTVGIFDAGTYTLKLHGYISLEERRDFIQTWQVRTNKHNYPNKMLLKNRANFHNKNFHKNCAKILPVAQFLCKFFSCANLVGFCYFILFYFNANGRTA